MSLLVGLALATGCTAGAPGDDDPGTGHDAIVSEVPEIPYHAFERHRRVYAVAGDAAFVRSPDDARGWPSGRPGIYVHGAGAETAPRLVVERTGGDQGSLQILEGALYFTVTLDGAGDGAELWRVRVSSSGSPAAPEKVLDLPVRGRTLVVSESEVYVAGIDALVHVRAGEEVERVDAAAGDAEDLVVVGGRLAYRAPARPSVVKIYDPATKALGSVDLRDDVTFLGRDGDALVALGKKRGWRIDAATRTSTRIDALLDAMDEAGIARCDESPDGRALHEGAATTTGVLVRSCTTFEGARGVYAFSLTGGTAVKLADLHGRTVSSLRASPARAFWFEENPRGWTLESAPLP